MGKIHHDTWGKWVVIRCWLWPKVKVARHWGVELERLEPRMIGELNLVGM